MLQQRRNEILYHKFLEIFRGIIPEKYRYFSGKIPQKFPEISDPEALAIFTVQSVPSVPSCFRETAVLTIMLGYKVYTLHGNNTTIAE